MLTCVCPLDSDLSRDSIAETMQNVESTSPLHLACAKNEYELVEALLQSNANVNTCDVQRNTPLHVAAMFGHIETVKLLLSVSGPLSIILSFVLCFND